MNQSSETQQVRGRGRPKKYHTEEERKAASLVYGARYRCLHHDELRERSKAWSQAHRDERNMKARERYRELHPLNEPSGVV